MAIRPFLVGLICAVAVSGSQSVPAQTSKGAWILGSWEGRHIAPTIPEDAARFELVADGDVIRWTMNRKGQIRLRQSTPDGRYVQNGEWRASGVVKKISDGAVELEGKYDDSSFSAVVGRAVTYELTGTSEALDGYLVGAQNIHFPISLKRAK
jgi:hypothetical protein